MPIIRSEPSVFPTDLLLSPESESDGREWWAAFTKPRQEKALARQLHAQQVPFYLPLVAKDHLIRGRKVKSYSPLFPGYVFLRVTDDERVVALTTNRIAQTLPVGEQQQLQHDLCQLQGLIAADAPLTIERRLEPGRLVRIKNGPMAGVEGVVTQRRKSKRLLVAVHFLQNGVSVEIDDFMVEPIN